MVARPLPDPDDDDFGPPPPEPEAAGRLDPPRRKPPTAVATATPRGPRRSPSPRPTPAGLTGTRRIAVGMLGGLLAASGAAVIALASGAAMLGGVALVGAGAATTWRALTNRTLRDELVAYYRRRAKRR